MSTPYKTCPDCGSHLDAGERCDCKRDRETVPESNEADRQAAGNPRGPVLVPGA